MRVSKAIISLTTFINDFGKFNETSATTYTSCEQPYGFTLFTKVFAYSGSGCTLQNHRYFLCSNDRILKCLHIGHMIGVAAVKTAMTSKNCCISWGF